MRLVVTGVTGFVGSHFAERALAAGHEVVGICSSASPEKAAIRAHLTRLGAKLIEGNMLKAESLAPAMQGSECVCHFAAAFRESGVEDDYFLKMNVQGTKTVIESAAAAGVKRFIYCSTGGIYGQRVPGIIDETMTAKPWNIYERSKVEAEQATRTLAVGLGMEYVILRPTSVYGPRDERLLKLFKSAAKGRFPLFGAGEGRRHMVYVTDVADAFLCASVLPSAASQECIVAGPQAASLRDMLKELAGVVGRPSCGPSLPLGPMMLLSAIVEDVAGVFKIKPPLYRRRMDFYLNDAAFSTQHARTVLGWTPKVGLREGLALTLASYRKDGLIS